jgi:hypothetical protein
MFLGTQITSSPLRGNSPRELSTPQTGTDSYPGGRHMRFTSPFLFLLITSNFLFGIITDKLL